MQLFMIDQVLLYRQMLFKSLVRNIKFVFSNALDKQIADNYEQCIAIFILDSIYK